MAVLRVPSGSTHDPRFAALDGVVRRGLGTGPEALYPGAVLVVAHRGEMVHAAAFGEAQSLTLNKQGAVERLAVPRGMAVGTIFDVASITKAVATTGALMRLVDAGRLGLDDRLGDLLPLFAHGDKAAITVRQLLTHRAGLWEWQPVWRHRDAEGRALAWLAALPLRYPVGERFAYSDLGFMLLGEIVTRVSGLALDEFAGRELFVPLGMADTGFRPDPGLRSRMAATSQGDLHQRLMAETGRPFPVVTDRPLQPFHDYRTDFLLGEVNDLNARVAWGGVAGHAGLFSTAPDVARFAQLLLNGGRYGPHRLLSPQTVARFLETPYDSAQALGFRKLRVEEGDVAFYGHPGFTGTMLHFAPALDLTIVLLTNRVHRAETETTQYPSLDAVRDALLTHAVEAVRP
jgi:CubicO group peptidase (beta-lactamase class C family)